MSPVSGVCSRLLTFSGVALKTKSLLLFLGAGTFGLYRAAAPAQAASRRRQSPVLFMRLPACGPVCPKFHQVPASVLEQGFFVLLPAGDGTASGGPRGPRAPRPAGSFSRTATPHGGWGSGSFAALFGGVFLPSPGCGALLLRRGTWPACKKQTAAPAPPRCICRRQRFGCAATRPQRLPHGCAIAP